MSALLPLLLPVFPRQCLSPADWVAYRVAEGDDQDYEKAANLYLNASKQSSVNSQNPDYMLNAGIYFLKADEKDEAKILFDKIKEDYSTSLANREVDKYLATIN